MTDHSTESLRHALIQAGFQIYRTRDRRVQLAERVRFHLMDSAVGVRIDEGLVVYFTVRAQRSDFPHMSEDDLFAKVREAVGELAETQGFVESGASTRQIKDPVDENKVLDVWHEVSFSKTAQDQESLTQDVRWALAVNKCVSP